ncbi:MAG: STAS domain-containing protein [bacterium]|nr:STAS domain-containing protein [bacterium]
MIHFTTDERTNLIVIHDIGKFDFKAVAMFESLFNKQLDKKPTVIAVNGGDRQFVNSSAMNTLVKYLKVVASKQVKVVFFDLAVPLEKLINMAKLYSFISLPKRAKFRTKYMAKPVVDKRFPMDRFLLE